VGYPGLCRLHRAQVLTVRGELGQAMDEINAVRDSLIRSSPWAEGEVWRVTGDIHTASGDFDQARICYQQAAACGFESGFEIALLKLFDGDAAGAAVEMRGLIEADLWSCQTKRGQAWTQYAIASAQAGDPDSARFALGKLADDPELVSTPALQLLVITARAELEMAEGRLASAVSQFRAAVASSLELDAPLAAARIRCRLALALLAADENSLAESEFSAAKAGFRKASTTLALRRCERVFRQAKRARDTTRQ
jgi:tetratricopeptide (TPR) repeat protein